MIRLGVCTDVQNINEIAEIGFDYLEFNLAKLAGLNEAEYKEVCDIVDRAPIKVEACNCMLPGEIKVVGEAVNAQIIHEYLDRAFSRAKRLGVKVIVFGSGNSRRVPEGFDTAVAWRQIGNYLRMAQRHAMENDLTVVIEPLRAGECNIMNFVSEATLMASLIQMPNIAVLADTYHMALGSEPLNALTMAGAQLKHVHIANAIGRKFPKEGDGERYPEIFETLKEMGYEGRVSIEAGCDDFSKDAREAFKVLNALRA